MGSDQQTVVSPRKSCDAVKAFCRIIAASFLSLLLPLSFLLLARLSTARYYLSIGVASSEKPHHNSFFTLFFLKTETTSILSLLVSLITVAALAHSLTGGGRRIPNAFISERRRFCGAWILLFVMQVCLSLGIHGTIDAEINSYTIGSLVLPRRVALVLGLHESMVFWWRCVVKPVVDETVSGLIREEFEWVQKAAMAVAFGHLWWRRVRDEAEALVVLPWVKAEMRMDVGMADVAGWCLYYLMVAIGVVRVVKGGAWIMTRIYRHWRNKI